ncbi:MAG: DUF1127 domain-containing protein [Rhizobiaceae bacterium]
MPDRRSLASGLSLGLARLRCQLKTWEERKRFRLQLGNMLETAPHLIDDVGLTKKHVEAEISKPFWRD